MRLPSTLSTCLATVLGLGLMIGCRQPVSTAPNGTTTGAATGAAVQEANATPQASLKANATEVQFSEDVPPAVFVEDGIAIRGADPVAYFTESRYVPGSADYTYEWADATWQFANAENRDLFAGNPEQYAPQYGGFCAWAVAEGYTAQVDPEAWKIVDGKLYLNYDARIQRRWQQDIPGNISRANENWPEVLNN